MRRPIRAFWSYASVTHENSRAYYQAMQKAMADILSFQGDVAIFFDQDRDQGITLGQNWSRKLVTEVSRSALFFWFQSANWFQRPVCRFEFDMFEDQLSTIAEEFSAADQPVFVSDLRAALLVPIVWTRVDDAAWAQAEPAVREQFEALVKLTQVDRSLNLARLHHEGGVGAYGPLEACRGASEQIKRNVLGAIPSLGGDIAPLLAFLEDDKTAFIGRWMAEFDQRNLAKIGYGPDPVSASAPAGFRRASNLIIRQKRLADRDARQLTRTNIAPFDIGMALVPLDVADGLWVSVEPLTPEQNRTFGLAATPVRDPSGHFLWPADTAAALAARFAGLSLRLPSEAEAQSIQVLFESPLDELRQLGLRSPPKTFWTSDSLQVGGDARPILFVKTWSAR
jgi:hypothetical protein